MEISLQAAGPLEVEDVEFTDGKLVGKPLFYGHGRHSNAFVIQVKDAKGRVKYTGLLQISGTSFGCSLINRTVPVKPVAERTMGTPEKGAEKSDDPH